MTRARDLADSADKDIVGTLNVDGLTVDTTSSPAITFQETTGTYGYKIHTAISSSTDYGLRLRTLANKELATFNSNGDISFYNPAGTSAQMTWKASDERLGIGTSSPSDTLSVVNYGASGTGTQISSGTATSDIRFKARTELWNGIVSVYDSGDNEDVRISASSGVNTYFNSGSNVGIGTSSPSQPLHVSTSTNPAVHITNTDGTNGSTLRMVMATNGAFIGTQNPQGGSDALRFGTGNEQERMRIDSSGTLITRGAAVFNEDGGDKDFRVESASNANAFRLDGDTGNIGVGTTPHSSTKLLVHENSDKEATIKVENESATANAVAALRLESTGNNFAILNYPDAGTEDNTTRFISTAGSSSLKFATGAVDRMAIQSNGRVDFNGPDYSYGNADNNYHIKLEENTHHAYISNINGTMFLASGGRYFGGNLRSLDTSETSYAGISVSNDVGFSVYGSTGHTAGQVDASTLLHHRLETTTGAAIFNDTGASTGDFRVESDSNANALFVNADTDSVVVNGTTGYGGANLTVWGAGSGVLSIVRSNLSGGSASGATGLWAGDAGSGVVILARDKTNINTADTVIYGEHGYNTQDERIRASRGYINLRADGATRVQINSSGINSTAVYNNTSGAGVNLGVASSGEFYRSTSSIKYKRDVQDAPHGLTELMTLRPVTYKSNSDTDGETVYGGLIAEEVHDAGLTEFVQYAEDGLPDALSYANMVSLCVKAIQDQQTMIETLEARITTLENA